MAARKIVQQDRTVYESPCQRVKVVRHAPRDFSLFLDGVYVKSYEFGYQAEHDGGVWLTEQTAQLAADLADEAATKEAAPVVGGDASVEVVGTLDGATVYGVSGYDCVAAVWTRYYVRVMWRGMKLSTDGKTFLSLPMSGGLVGDMELSEWARLKALAQTDAVERLMEIGRVWCAGVPILTVGG